MKTLLFLFLLPLGALAQKMTAVEYNDKIIGYQNEIGYKLLAIGEYIGSEEITTEEGANAVRLEALEVTRESIKGLEKMGAFKGDDALRKSALNLFRFYEKIIKDQYAQMIDLIYKEDFSEADSDAISLLVAKITEEEMPLDQKFQTAQIAFAEKNNIELQDNPLQEELDK